MSYGHICPMVLCPMAYCLMSYGPRVLCPMVILSYALWPYCLMSYCLTSYGHTVYVLWSHCLISYGHTVLLSSYDPTVVCPTVIQSCVPTVLCLKPTIHCATCCMQQIVTRLKPRCYMIVSALLQPCYNLLHATCCTVYGGL